MALFDTNKSSSKFVGVEVAKPIREGKRLVATSNTNKGGKFLLNMKEALMDALVSRTHFTQLNKQ
jgi:hypothetical protein